MFSKSELQTLRSAELEDFLSGDANGNVEVIEWALLQSRYASPLNTERQKLEAIRRRLLWHLRDIEKLKEAALNETVNFNQPLCEIMAVIIRYDDHLGFFWSARCTEDRHMASGDAKGPLNEYQGQNIAFFKTIEDCKQDFLNKMAA